MPDLCSIDIVVPSYRLNEECLLGIVQLPKPEGYRIRPYIVSDNPKGPIPESIRNLHTDGILQLIIHEQNQGPAAARNTGIRAGSGQWILLLDDDIRPEKNLLSAYTRAIEENPQAIGFAGETIFPEPVNAATMALLIGGSVSHFAPAIHHKQVRWAPTANILLNREKMDPTLFDESLKKGGEDIDFLLRGSLLNGQSYPTLAEAIVYHPWWNGGRIQTKRMFRYGAGASEIAEKEPVSDYTFLDFTNTSESLLLCILLIPLALVNGFLRPLLLIIPVLLITEFLTNWIKVLYSGKSRSLLVAGHLFWIKNSYEAGFLFASLKRGFWNGYARRIDMGFNKPHPGAFRTNRWKIIKMILIALLWLIAVITF